MPDTQPPLPGATARPARAAAVIILTLALLFPILLLGRLAPLPFARASLAMRIPWYQLDNEEGALLFQTLEMKQGRTIYRPLTDYPYVAGTYPPLYMLACAPFADADNPTFYMGRAMTAGAALGIAVLIMAITGMRAGNALAGVAGGLAFLATFEVYNWIAYYRADLPAIFLSLLGLMCVEVSQPRNRTAKILSVLFFAAAFYTKQTVLAAPLAAVIHYFLRCGRRAGLSYLAGLAAALAVPFVILNLLTHGQFFEHTVIYNMNTWHAGDLLIWMRHAWRFYPWLIMAGGVALTAGFIALLPRRGDAGAGPVGVIALYALFSLVGFAAVGKAGSAENYLLEPLAAVCLLVGEQFGRMIRIVLKGGRPLPAVMIAAALVLLMGAHSYRVKSLRPIMFSPLKNPGSRDVAAAREAVIKIMNEPGRTWSELGILNLAAGRSIYFQPFIMSELARQRRWNPGHLYDDLREGRFALLVTNYDVASRKPTDVYTTEMLDILRSRYEQTDQITGGRLWKYYLYRPRAPINQENLVSLDIARAAPS